MNKPYYIMPWVCNDLCKNPLHPQHQRQHWPRPVGGFPQRPDWMPFVFEKGLWLLVIWCALLKGEKGGRGAGLTREEYAAAAAAVGVGRDKMFGILVS